MSSKTTKYHVLSCPECPHLNERFDTSSLEEHLGSYHLQHFAIYACTGCREKFSSTYRAHRHLDKCPYVKQIGTSLQLIDVQIEDLRKIHHWVNVAVKNYSNRGLSEIPLVIKHDQQTLSGVSATSNRSNSGFVRLPSIETDTLPSVQSPPLDSNIFNASQTVSAMTLLSHRELNRNGNTSRAENLDRTMDTNFSRSPVLETDAQMFLNNDLDTIRNRPGTQIITEENNFFNFERPPTPLSNVQPINHSTPKKPPLPPVTPIISDHNLNVEHYLDLGDDRRREYYPSLTCDNDVFDPPEDVPLPIFTNIGTQPYYDIISTMQIVDRISHHMLCTDGGLCVNSCPKFQKLKSLVREYPSFYNQCLISHTDVAKYIRDYLKSV